MNEDATRFLFTTLKFLIDMFRKVKQNQSHFTKNYMPGWSVNLSFLISRRCIKTDKFGSFLSLSITIVPHIL